MQDQALPDGTWWEPGLHELDIESHMMLCQDCCYMGCFFLISICNGLGQVCSQLFYK